MKKWVVVPVLLFCAMSLFGQDFFSLVQTGTPEQVETAIKNGAKLNDEDKYKMTPLMYAAAFNENPDVITILLNAGAKPDGRNGYGDTPLMYAAWSNNNPAVITLLLKAGARIDNRNISGETPLMQAAGRNKNPDVVITLLNAGAEINERDDDGKTPLMYAAEGNENPDVITALLNAGAKIDEQDFAGLTPLMWAAWLNKNPAVVLTLLNAGANAKLTTKQSWSALNYAEKNPILKGTSAYDELKKATFASNTSTASKPSVNSWVSTSFGSYRVERMWEDYGYTYVLVSYRNTTNRTFNDTVKLNALLYDANNHMLDVEDGTLYAFQNGPMSPGFEGTVKISFPFVGAKRVEIRITGY